MERPAKSPAPVAGKARDQMRPWRRRQLRTEIELRSAVRQLAAILQDRARRLAPVERIRPLSESEIAAVLGADLVEQLRAVSSD